LATPAQARRLTDEYGKTLATSTRRGNGEVEHLTVLLVDPSRDQREMYSDALHYAGFVVIECPNAQYAFDLACQVPLTAIVTEVGSNQAGSGWELIERLRSDHRTSGLPIIALGSRQPAAERERSMASGVNEYFHTPLLPDELINAIHRVASASPEG
jgi:DNA-binding response OmpR family regulator